MFFGKTYYVYVMASAPHGVLYVGMSSDLVERARQHRERLLDGFSKRYWVNRLVYFEAHDDAAVAAQRERTIKRWRRAWKIELIETSNPTWKDLWLEIVAAGGYDPA